MKVFAWILTAAAILIGADVFVASPDAAEPEAAAVEQPDSYRTSLHGGSGMPPPPPD